MQKYDIIVIGAGPGGYVAAIRASQLGQKVALIEKSPTVGGTCLNIGCIPSKVLLDSTELYRTCHSGGTSHGLVFKDLTFDLAALMKRKRATVAKLTNGIANLIAHNNITLYEGEASFKNAAQVQISKDTYTTIIEGRHIIIATGSVPQEIPSLPFDGKVVVSSTEALAFSQIPPRLMVVGGGAIGLELGSVWQRVGSEVTVCELQERILPTADVHVSQALKKILEIEGMRMHLGTSVQSVAPGRDAVTVTIANKNGTHKIEVDKVLVAVGRAPHTQGLGLENIAGSEVFDSKGRIIVNQRFESTIPGIYAIGDVIPGPMLAHKAEEDGVVVVEQIVTGIGAVNYRTIPNVVYTWPEVAMVGETEEQLAARKYPYKVGRFPFAANGRALAMHSEVGFVKLLSCKESDTLLGAHIIGPWASALISELVTVMEFEGSAEDVARIVHAHPTLPEVVKEAALNVGGRALHIAN